MDDRITIDLDDGTLDALGKMAEAHGRSVGDEVREIVRSHIATTTRLSPEDAIQRAREIRAMAPPGVKQTSSVQLIREDRDR
jgi:plasmid stability protein